jgi:recombination-promoting nuclease RpnB
MKKRNPNTLHDAAFRNLLSERETAQDFMNMHIPPELHRHCDFSSLKMEPGSWVEKELRPYYSDVLYSVNTTTGCGYVYVLIEHSKNTNKLMAFRLMRYAMAVMQHHLDAGNDTLPLVIPILFYAGLESPYPYSTNWFDGFEKPVQAKKLYSAALPLVDVTVLSDEEILTHKRMAPITLIQKYINQHDMVELLDKLAEVFQSEYTDDKQLIHLVNYLISAGESRNADTFLQLLAKKTPQYKETLMSIALQLEQKAMEKGIKEGIERGKEEGLKEGIQLGEQKGSHEATMKIARTMLKNGLDKATVMKMTGLTEVELFEIN